MPDDSLPDPIEVHLLAAQIAQLFELRDARVPDALSALGAVVEETIRHAYKTRHDRDLIADRFAKRLRIGVRRA